MKPVYAIVSNDEDESLYVLACFTNDQIAKSHAEAHKKSKHGHAWVQEVILYEGDECPEVYPRFIMSAEVGRGGSLKETTEVEVFVEYEGGYKLPEAAFCMWGPNMDGCMILAVSGSDAGAVKALYDQKLGELRTHRETWNWCEHGHVWSQAIERDENGRHYLQCLRTNCNQRLPVKRLRGRRLD